MAAEFSVAERSAGNRLVLLPLRIALVIIFFWFGCMKFTAYEAHGISGLLSHSPIVGWLGPAFGVQGASDVIGIIELATCSLLVLGAFVPVASALGAAMSCCTFLVTLSFFVTTPGVFEPMAGGFPAISGSPGGFLLKDLVLFSASLTLLLASIRSHRPAGRVWRGTERSAGAAVGGH